MQRFVHLLVFLLLCGVAGPLAQAAAQSGDEKTLEERLEEIDVTDPDQLFVVADWAMNNKKSGSVRREGRKLMAEILELDPEHAKARAALGHVKVGDTWYESEKEAKRAKLKLLEEEMEAKGFVKFRGGFIHKDRKRDWERDWEMDDDLVWRSKTEIMEAKGFRLIKGSWVKMSSADLARADRHRKLTGEDVIVTSTPHFRVHSLLPPKFAVEHAELVEKLYSWFFDTFEIETLVKRDALFPRPVDVWHFYTPQQFQDWVTTYSEEYQWTEEERERFRERPNGYLIPGKLVIIIVREKAEDHENPLIHQTAIMMLEWFARFRTAPWFSEAFGHLAEHMNSKEKYGFVNNTTNSRYGGQGGIAGKEFNTKDMPPAMKAIVKRADDMNVLQLSLLPLNSLNGDHLAQGFSHMEWMFNNVRPSLIAWMHAMRTLQLQNLPSKQEERMTAFVEACIKASFDGATAEDFMARWREYVKKNYR